MTIIEFEERYRDDMIFMILETKNALGRVPGLNPDLLDIKQIISTRAICFGLHWTKMAE